VSHSIPRRFAPILVVLGVALGACGGSGSATPLSAPTTTPASTVGTTPPPPPVPTPAATVAQLSSPTTTAASPSCPTGAVVGAALGISLPAPVGVVPGGGTQFPAGATAVVCDYHGSAFNVIIELIANVDPTFITKFSAKFPVPATSVSGVGDQAFSFSVTLGGGKDNEGVVATKGSTLVDVTATATPASLTQIEALVDQIL
jgi:hypothetical protein